MSEKLIDRFAVSIEWYYEWIELERELKKSEDDIKRSAKNVFLIVVGEL